MQGDNGSIMTRIAMMVCYSWDSGRRDVRNIYALLCEWQHATSGLRHMWPSSMRMQSDDGNIMTRMAMIGWLLLG